MFFDDQPLSLSKTTSEIAYNDQNKFIKFIPDKTRLNNLVSRSKAIEKFVPRNIESKENFLSYDWASGATLYELNNLETYNSFIDFYFEHITLINSNKDDLKSFYIDKTKKRIDMFIELNGESYYKNKFTINGNSFPSMEETIASFDFSALMNNKFTKNFHGDLQFDNIILSEDNFLYIDWRDSFGSSLEYGDVYYDLGKHMVAS